MKFILLVLLILSPVHAAVALEVGDKAPDFLLAGTDGKTYSLSQFQGDKSVVLAWFPKAYTRGCTIECKSLAEKGHLIRAHKVAYFMVSVDPIEENKGFADKEKADFPLLSDPSKETANAYGVLHERGFAMRQTFFINPDGSVAAVHRKVNPGTAAEDIAKTLGELGVPLAE